MSARTAHHLFRPAATAVVVAAVAGTVLMPMSAQAAPSDDSGRPLVLEMGTPAPNGPLTRGGAAETFELTVHNPTATAQAFHPWMLGDAVGASPLQNDDVTFKVEAVDAPATKSFVGHQDGGWQGVFYPSAKDASAGFDVPANGKLSWKVTIGLGAGYPTNDGDFKLTATSISGEVAANHQASHTFKADPQIKAGHLKTWFVKTADSSMDRPGERQHLELKYQATGDGVFAGPLTTQLQLSFDDAKVHNTFFAQALIDGRWQELKLTDNGVRLPVIPKGFGAASGVHTLPLRISVAQQPAIKKLTPVTVEARVGLASGNTYPFETAKLQFGMRTKDEATVPAGKPSAKPTGTPTGTPSAKPVTAAAAVPVTAGNANLTTTSATGSLAHTGADSRTGLYAGIAGALVAIGAAVALLGARRRRGSAM
ncbi:hypothetical protein [Streptomyces sp. NPDC048111]|uniref:hypothetical protein n=1 Tax=Streptomyces sp. NPDC048111 TaxID=3365500 RepID=UPI003710C0E3